MWSASCAKLKTADSTASTGRAFALLIFCQMFNAVRKRKNADSLHRHGTFPFRPAGSRIFLFSFTQNLRLPNHLQLTASQSHLLHDRAMEIPHTLPHPDPHCLRSSDRSAAGRAPESDTLWLPPRFCSLQTRKSSFRSQVRQDSSYFPPDR